VGTDDAGPRDADRPVKVEVPGGMLAVTLIDGRVIATPMWWYPRLASASAEQLAHAEFSPGGIHWPELDEGLSVRGMLLGQYRLDATDHRKAV